MDRYKIKDMFYTLEGEGANVNKPIVIVELAGCNLSCPFCDLDIAVRREMTAEEIRKDVEKLSLNYIDVDGEITGEPFVLLTGGEAMIQVDKELIDELRKSEFSYQIGLETNGTIELGDIEVDYIIVRPKPGAPIVITEGDELKVVYPVGVDPAQFNNLNFKRFFVTPWIAPCLDKMSIVDMRADNIMACINYCLRNPQWSFSIQSHKIYGIK